MITAWITGLILSILGIWLLKNSRIPEIRNFSKIEKPERPILKVWSLILLIIGAVIPILNIIMSSIVILQWGCSINSNSWKFTKEDTRIIRLLNKPIQ